MKYILSAVFAGFCSITFAQTATIKGRITDASTEEALPFSNVFISNTTLGTTSDKEGNFEIRNVPMPGTYEVIASYVGYESYTQKVDVSESEVTLRAIKLKPSETLLSDVEVQGRRDKEWEKKMKRFTKVFLGTDPEARRCKILNPWVVDFHKNDDPNLLLATASSPIMIENEALGYKIRFVLVRFSSTLTDYSINGKSFFEEMQPANDEQAAAWKIERERSYRNSKQYLFKSIIEKRIAGNGFRLYSELAGSKGNRSIFFNREELGRSVTPCDTLELVKEGPGKDLYTIFIPRRLEVHNTTEKDKSSIYRDVLHPISWIESKTGRIVVTKNGMEVNTSDAVTRGSMSDLRVSRIIPTDFKPSKNPVEPPPPADFGFLQEKIYVHTDRSYYYPGETIWFNGYINYRTLSLRDSLSTTVYTEVIGPGKKVVASKMLEIIDGSFHNEFVLSDTLPVGDYYLRCYTTLNRNFGDDHLYTKYIPVFDVHQAVDIEKNDTAMRSNDVVKIILSKNEYKAGEQISLTLLAGESGLEALSGASLSISVTDATQVVPVNFSNTILDEFDATEAIRVQSLNYPVEYGFGFSAHYEPVGESTSDLLNIFQVDGRDHRIANADQWNNFTVSGLHFYDSLYFAVLPNGRSKGVGTTTVLPRELPPVSLPTVQQKIAVIQTEVTQRPHYKTDDVTILEEITIESTRIPGKRTYGRPERVVTGDDIRATNSKTFFEALQKMENQFNGLMIRRFFDPVVERSRWYIYILNSNERAYDRIPREVIITINDNRVFGLPEDILRGIFLANVKSVELYTQPHLIYGNTLSNYGVLSIYTTTDEWIDTAIDRSKNVLVYGYRRPSVFNSQGSTIYWNPLIRLDEKGTSVVTFSAAERGTTYKVVVEGISANGTPIRAEKMIKILAE